MHTNTAEIRRMSQDENRLTLLRSIVKQEEDRDSNQVARVTRVAESFATRTGMAQMGLQPGTTAAREHESLRRALESDVEAFIAQGGQVERLAQMDKFEMATAPGYGIIYGAKDGRRWKGAGHG